MLSSPSPPPSPPSSAASPPGAQLHTTALHPSLPCRHLGPSPPSRTVDLTPGSTHESHPLRRRAWFNSHTPTARPAASTAAVASRLLCENADLESRRLHHTAASPQAPSSSPFTLPSRIQAAAPRPSNRHTNRPSTRVSIVSLLSASPALSRWWTFLGFGW